jgi:TonB family protein
MRMNRTMAVALLITAGCASVPTSQGVAVPVAPPTRPVEQLVASLRSPDSVTRALSAWQLAGAVAPDEDIRSALVVALDDPVQKVREAATWSLSHVGFGDLKPYDEAPRPTLITRPRYPQGAFDKRLEGTVELEILIGEAGNVAHADIRKSIPELDQAAVDCVRMWTFEPAHRNGKPVAAVGTAPVSFRIY